MSLEVVDDAVIRFGVKSDVCDGEKKKRPGQG